MSLTTTPKIWSWYVAYCLSLALVYFLLFLGGILFFLFLDRIPPEERAGLIFAAIFCIVLGLVFCVGFAAGPFLPKKPSVWIYGMVLICIGMTSACCLPASIPLLIFWIKPETKAFFGRA